MLWGDDGAPINPLPVCPVCGENELGSLFGDCWCTACSRRAPLPQVLEEEFASRPGRRLLELLEQRELEFADFAVAVGMASEPKDEERVLRRRARANLRRYTHPPDGSDPKWPSVGMIQRWARELGVDAGVFYAAR